MPYRINRFNGEHRVTVPDNQILSAEYRVINTQPTVTPVPPIPVYRTSGEVINLVGRNTANFGSSLSESLLWTTENFASPAETVLPRGTEDGVEFEYNVGPSKSLKGQLWYETETNQLNLCLEEGRIDGSSPWYWNKVPTAVRSTLDPSDVEFNVRSHVLNSDGSTAEYDDSNYGSIWIDTSNTNSDISIHNGNEYKLIPTQDESKTVRFKNLPVMGFETSTLESRTDVVLFDNSTDHHDICEFTVPESTLTRYKLNLTGLVLDAWDGTNRTIDVGSAVSGEIEVYVASSTKVSGDVSLFRGRTYSFVTPLGQPPTDVNGDPVSFKTFTWGGAIGTGSLWTASATLDPTFGRLVISVTYSDPSNANGDRYIAFTVSQDKDTVSR